MISQASMVNEFIYNIGQLQTSLATSEQQLASGNSVNQPSDNPVAAAQIVSLNTLLSQNATYAQNTQNGISILQASTQTIGSALTLMQSAQQIAVQGQNSTLTSQDMSAMADQVNALLEQMLTTANQQYSNTYLFSGTQTAAPFVATRDAQGLIQSVTYTGDTGVLQRTYGPSQTIPISLPGSQVFQGSTDMFAALVSLRNDLQAGNQTNIATDLTSLGQGMAQLTNADSSLGADLQRLQLSQSALQSYGQYLQTQLASTQSANIPAVTLQFSEQQASLQAALQAGSKIMQTTLLNYLG